MVRTRSPKAAASRNMEACALLGVPTGAPGRAVLARALSVVDRGEPAVLALVDVDEFHAINRLIGAERADEVLKAVTRRVITALPPGAELVRLGGDVLAVGLAGHELEQGLIAGQAICAGVARSPIAAGKGSQKRMAYPTVSVGVAPAVAGKAGLETVLDETIARAQAALRRAKELGRGRVAAPPEDRMVLKTSYYTQSQLGRLRALAQRLSVPESTLLRQAIEDLLLKHKERTSAASALEETRGALEEKRGRAKD